MLIPEEGGRPGQAITDESGRFAIGTFSTADGALPGRHAVTVVLHRIHGISADPDGLEGDVAPGGPQIEWLVPRRYSDPQTSGLTVEVERRMPPLMLELQSP